jgi:hypothetical protein
MLTEFLNSINQTKENILASDPKLEKEYVPYVINKCFSYFPETIFHANRMNMVSHIDKKLQYDYYFYSVSKRKRFSKWIKPENNTKIDLIKQVYGYSDAKAREVSDLLSEEDLQHLVQKGGQKR